MASSSEHQGLQIAVIIFALLTIIMSGATFYVFKLSEDAELRAAEANRKSADSTTALATAIKDLEDTLKMLGTKYAAMGVNPKMDDVRAEFSKDMAAYAGTMVPEKQAYADALEDARTAQQKVSEELVAERKRLETLAADVAAATKDKQDQTAAAQQTAATAQDMAKDSKIKQDEDRKKLTDEKQVLFKDKQDMEQQLREKITQQEQDAKKAADELNKLKLIKEGIQDTLEGLQKKSFVAADGEIRWISPQTKTVWINLGRADGLKKNVTFSVYGLDQNGVARSEPKGSVEVTQILGANLSEARILEDNLSDPILIRDQLYTPLWHPGRTEQFAIAGLLDLDKDGVSDVGFIKDLIRRNGGELVAELMPDGSISSHGEGMTFKTRYLIRGEAPPNIADEYGAMLKNAKQLGVEDINLEKFLDYVGWKDTSKVVNFGRDADPNDFLYDPNQDKAKRPTSNSAGANNFRRRTPTRGGSPSAYQRQP